jgi:hypothetical protein
MRVKPMERFTSRCGFEHNGEYDAIFAAAVIVVIGTTLLGPFLLLLVYLG